MTANELDDLKPVHIGHIQVEYHKLHRRKREMLYGFKPACGFVESDIFEIAQRSYYHAPHRRRIVNDKDSFHIGLPLKREAV
jgi:hypothetical protein